VTLADVIFNFGGVVLILIGGFGMAAPFPIGYWRLSRQRYVWGVIATELPPDPHLRDGDESLRPLSHVQSLNGCSAWCMASATTHL